MKKSPPNFDVNGNQFSVYYILIVHEVKLLDKINQLRNEHLKDSNPELYEMLKKYYE